MDERGPAAQDAGQDLISFPVKGSEVVRGKVRDAYLRVVSDFAHRVLERALNDEWVDRKHGDDELELTTWHIAIAEAASLRAPLRSKKSPWWVTIIQFVQPVAWAAVGITGSLAFTPGGQGWALPFGIGLGLAGITLAAKLMWEKWGAK